MHNYYNSYNKYGLKKIYKCINKYWKYLTELEIITFFIGFKKPKSLISLDKIG